jgi:hypothetical protein
MFRRVLAAAYGLLALSGTIYFVYALFDSLLGDYVGGEVGVVWLLTGMAAVLSALFWWGAFHMWKRAGARPDGVDENDTDGVPMSTPK